jgi:hypothetical protein
MLPSDTDPQAPSTPLAHWGLRPEGAPIGRAATPGESGPSLGQLLRNVAPSLWAKARSERRLRREQTERLLELLVWVLEKNGARVSHPARQEYFVQGRVVEGRLDLLAERGGERLALEVAFRPSLAAALKLLSARRTGASALLLCGFGATPGESRQAVDRLLGKSTDGWFSLACL